MFKFKTMCANADNCQIVTRGSGLNTKYEVWSEEGPECVLNLIGYHKQLDKQYRRPDVLVIKDYSENTGVLNELCRHGVVKKLIGYLSSGFVDLPVVEVDLEKLKSL